MNFGFRDNGAGDGDALALTAGKLVRVAVTAIRVEIDFFKRLDYPALAFRFAADPAHVP